MMKRVTWFALGAAAGVTGSAYAKRKVRETAERLAPTNLARVASERVRQRGREVAEAVREGRAAMAAKEEELRRRVGEPRASADSGLVPPALAAGAAPVEYVVLEARAVEPRPLRAPGPRRRARRSPR